MGYSPWWFLCCSCWWRGRSSEGPGGFSMPCPSSPKDLWFWCNQNWRILHWNHILPGGDRSCWGWEGCWKWAVWEPPHVMWVQTLLDQFLCSTKNKGCYSRMSISFIWAWGRQRASLCPGCLALCRAQGDGPNLLGASESLSRVLLLEQVLSLEVWQGALQIVPWGLWSLGRR